MYSNFKKYMKKYILDSIDKFKKDALSKIIYEFLKYLLITFFTVITLKFIPIIKEFLQTKLDISLWLFLIIIISVVTILFIFFSVIYNYEFKKLKEKNQIDELTGTKNHKALEEILDNIFANKIDKNSFPISLILFDIDNF